MTIIASGCRDGSDVWGGTWYNGCERYTLSILGPDGEPSTTKRSNDGLAVTKRSTVVDSIDTDTTVDPVSQTESDDEKPDVSERSSIGNATELSTAVTRLVCNDHGTPAFLVDVQTCVEDFCKGNDGTTIAKVRYVTLFKDP